MIETFLDISFQGYFLARLATDPDPSFEQRGISGFTYAVAGESLLDPSTFFQREDVLETYGWKDPAFRISASDGDANYEARFNVKNIREASPDFNHYRENGIGVKVTEVKLAGKTSPELTDKLTNMDMRVRITNQGVPTPEGQIPRSGPIFEGRNQIDSDGDPDRFTLNPFVIQMLTYSPKDDGQSFDRNIFLSRYDPLDHLNPQNPQPPLYQLTNFDAYYDRLPKQRFGASQTLLDQIGVSDATEHFVYRQQWLQGRIAIAEALQNEALLEAYKSRAYAVNFFTQATGPTVAANRLASRIPLRQLYEHPIRGTAGMIPSPVVDESIFNDESSNLKISINLDQPWSVLYYLGAYDGDLMAGYSTGVLSVPVTLEGPLERDLLK